MDIEISETSDRYDFAKARSPSEIEVSARFWQGGIFDATDPRGLPASSYDWRFVHDYPLAALDDPEFDWTGWFEEERKIWSEEGDPDRYDNLMQDEFIREPIVLVEHQGRGWVWDGYHRTGASLAVGRSTIPAYVGCIKA